MVKDTINSDSYKDFVDQTTNFLSSSLNKRLFMHVSILSPIRRDFHFNIIKNRILSPNYLRFYLIQISLLIKHFLDFILYFSNYFYNNLISNYYDKGFHSISISNNRNLLLITHCNKLEQINFNVDSYYGFPKNLKNASFLILNKTGIFGRKLLNKISNYQISNSFLLNLPSSLLSTLSAYKHCYNSHRILFIQWLRNPSDRLMLAASIDSISLSSVTNFIIYQQVKDILCEFKFKQIVFTWEGYPWERLVTNYCRLNNIISYGYIHAGPFRDQFSAFRLLGLDYEPNYLLTHTKVSRSLLSSFHQKSSYSIGSHKSQFIANNLGHSSFIQSRYSSNKKRLLIVPQGTIKEVKLLFDFALKSLNTKFSLILRLHPALQNNKSLSKYIKAKIRNSKFKTNIIFSSSTLLEDINTSSHFLYAASTSAIECLALGLTPIHLENTDNLDSLEGYNIPKEFHVSLPSEIPYLLNKQISNKYIKDIIEDHSCPFDLSFFN